MLHGDVGGLERNGWGRHLKLTARMRTAALGPIFAGAMLSGAGPAAAAQPSPDAAFTIGNYPVDATAADAVKAKERALADGQQAAFRSLLKRIVPVTAYQRLKRLPAIKAGDFIDGVSVRSERNSSTQYIASLDFSFQPKAVRDLLKREGVPFVDAQAPEIVIVPVMQGASAGQWKEAWQGLDVAHALTPAKLDSLKTTIAPDTVKMTLAGDGGSQRILSPEYNSERVVLAVADIDQSAKKLIVTLAGTDAVGPFAWKKSYRLGSDPQYAMELAAVVGLGVLEGRWKAVKSVGRGGAEALAEPSESVQLTAEFQSLAQWNDLRRQLMATPGVDNVNITAISARSADILLSYPGGPSRLADAVAAQGLALVSQSGSWTLRSRF